MSAAVSFFSIIVLYVSGLILRRFYPYTLKMYCTELVIANAHGPLAIRCKGIALWVYGALTKSACFYDGMSAFVRLIDTRKSPVTCMFVLDQDHQFQADM